MNSKTYRITALLLFSCLTIGCVGMRGGERAATESKIGRSMNVKDVSASDRNSTEQVVASTGANEVDEFGALGQPSLYSSVQGAYKGRPLTKHIGDYVKNMTQDLVSNMEYVSNKTPIGVTHFAMLDTDLQQTNLLGHQMAESFLHELHKFRVPVLDFKMTNYIRITDHGDFVLTRDYLEVASSLPIEYVLTGTMAKHQGGVMVNARIVGLDSRAVVASAQMLIPFYVVDALMPSDGSDAGTMRDGVRLSRG